MIIKFATLLGIALAKRELESIPVLDAHNYGKVYRINHPENVKAEDFLAVSEFIELQFQSAVDIWATNKDFIDVHVHNDLEEIFEETLEAFELKSYRVYYKNLTFDKKMALLYFKKRTGE